MTYIIGENQYTNQSIMKDISIGYDGQAFNTVVMYGGNDTVNGSNV